MRRFLCVPNSFLLVIAVSSQKSMVNALLSKRKPLWILNFAKLKFNFTMKFERILIAFVTLLSGCAGLSHQYRASTEGMSVSYTVNKEQFINPKAKVFISSSDERLDKEIFGDGAKPSAGTRALGFVFFGVYYAPALLFDQPTLKDQQDPIRIFKTATSERLSKNGITVTNDKDNDVLVVDLLVRQFKLDFSFGKWIGEVG